MATITELVISRQLGKSSGTLNYVIIDTSSESTALAALVAGTNSTWQGLTRTDYGIEPIGDPTISEMWLGTVSYGDSQAEEIGSSTFSFDTGGGTTHITQSLSTISNTAVSGTAPVFDQAIGVTKNGLNATVAGVDIITPIYSFSETHIMDADDVTLTYRGKLFNTTGKVNDASFKGCDAGECLFLGASGSQRNADEWEITFNFAGSPNRSSLVVSPDLTVAKKGWEYLWVYYGEKLHTSSKTIVKYPTSCHVEKVYDSASFSDLGIGT